MTTPAQRHSTVSNNADGDEALRTWLSELADGEADADTAQAASAAWRDSAEARRTWHAYHLIGDVLRSEELARPAAADARFLAGLRDRLAQEPVVLAPAPLPSAVGEARRRQRWLAPAAVAAGFVAVAGVLVVTRLAVPPGGAEQPVLARSAPGAVAGNGLTLATGGGGMAGASLGNGSMLRDPRLDAYINAHQSMRAGGAAAVPGAALRSVDVVVPSAPAAATR